MASLLLLIQLRIFSRLQEKCAKKGYTNWECYTPIPIHGLDGQMGYSRSKVPCFTLAGGVTGFFTGMLIVWFMNSYDYPLIVGGKPYFSPIFLFLSFTNLPSFLPHLELFLGCSFLIAYQDTTIPSLNTKHLEELEMTSL